ncbi:Nicotinamidase-related amidase [Granulicella rosea]|uniref:Nicotinamidase-related amidase n=1 Tax=Granulicella rosea TaxID=474952 RepID=A0A239CR20_9BACT|nr:isochorismatase family protein [Granulicella rosea]SNS22547.1 Nicotinamidase-related amidase [Granulicella rosea]
MSTLAFDPAATALILIDLQNAIKARNPVPHSFDDVVARSVALGDKLRAAGGTVVYVNVDVADMQTHVADRSMRNPNDPPPPAIMSELVPECGIQPGDLTITKRSWGAFLKTTLDEQLRAKGVTTIILGGVATNIGVESTARSAYDLGYDIVFAEDAMATLSQEMHDFTIKVHFPMMGRVRSTAEILEAL